MPTEFKAYLTARRGHTRQSWMTGSLAGIWAWPLEPNRSPQVEERLEGQPQSARASIDAPCGEGKVGYSRDKFLVEYNRGMDTLSNLLYRCTSMSLSQDDNPLLQSD